MRCCSCCSAVSEGGVDSMSSILIDFDVVSITFLFLGQVTMKAAASAASALQPETTTPIRWRHVVPGCGQRIAVSVFWVDDDDEQTTIIIDLARGEPEFVTRVPSNKITKRTHINDFKALFPSREDADALVYFLADVGAFRRFTSNTESPMDILMSSSNSKSKQKLTWRVGTCDFLYMDSLTARLLRIAEISRDLVRYASTKKGKSALRVMLRVPYNSSARVREMNDLMVRAERNAWRTTLTGILPNGGVPRFPMSIPSPTTVLRIFEKTAEFLRGVMHTTEIVSINQLDVHKEFIIKMLTIVSSAKNTTSETMEAAKIYNTRIATGEFGGILKEKSKYFCVEVDGPPLEFVAQQGGDLPPILQTLEKHGGALPAVPATATLYQSHKKKHLVEDTRFVQYSDLDLAAYYDAVRQFRDAAATFAEIEKVITQIDVASALTAYRIDKNAGSVRLHAPNEKVIEYEFNSIKPYDAIPKRPEAFHLRFARRYDPASVPAESGQQPISTLMAQSGVFTLAATTKKTTTGMSLVLACVLANSGIPICGTDGSVPELSFVGVVRRPLDAEDDGTAKLASLQDDVAARADADLVRVSKFPRSFVFCDDVGTDSRRGALFIDKYLDWARDVSNTKNNKKQTFVVVEAPWLADALFDASSSSKTYSSTFPLMVTPAFDPQGPRLRIDLNSVGEHVADEIQDYDNDDDDDDERSDNDDEEDA